MKILVVDDEQLLVKGIKFNLESEGYQVEAGYDGEEAVELYLHGSPVVLGETETVQPCIDPQEAVALLQKSQVGGLSQSVTLAEQVEAPVSTGQELGTLTLTDAAGETVQSIPIRAAQSVERLTFGTMLRRMLSAAFFAG